MKDYQGKCLCGAVEYSVAIEEKEVGACNCGMCRRWSAGPLMMVHGSHAPKVADESQLGVYSSSDWGERCFCKTCGTSLFWRSKDGSFFGVAADTLEGIEDFTFSTEIFIDRKPDYYKATDKTKRMTEAQFWEMVQSEHA